MDSFEHQLNHANKIRPYIQSSQIRIHEPDLWQFSDEEFDTIMQGGLEVWDIYKMEKKLNNHMYSETGIPNVFYRVGELSCDHDAMILDGPHGNGRSIAYAMCVNLITEPGYILIDDCNHYDFIYDRSLFFRFNVVNAEVYPSVGWALLEVTSQ